MNALDLPIETPSPATSDSARRLTTFEVFFRENYAFVVSSALRVVGHMQEAEEVAAEAFTKLYHHRAPVQNPLGWLKHCAIRLSLDRLRANQRRRRREEESPPPSAGLGPESSLRERQEQAQVRRILAELPARDAGILLARFDGYSYAELAQSFGVNPASVGKMLARAESNFKRRYENRYGKQ